MRHYQCIGEAHAFKTPNSKECECGKMTNVILAALEGPVPDWDTWSVRQKHTAAEDDLLTRSVSLVCLLIDQCNRSVFLSSGCFPKDQSEVIELARKWIHEYDEWRASCDQGGVDE